MIPPVILNNNVLEGYFNFQFDETSISKSKKAGKIYKKHAQICHCEFFDINEFTKPSDIDGLHYDKIGHKIIADKLANFLNFYIFLFLKFNYINYLGLSYFLSLTS